MRYFPAFFDLRDRLVLVLGATPAALQRLRYARSAGARVRLFAPALDDEGGRAVVGAGIAWLPGRPEASDYAAADLVFAASDDAAQNGEAAAAARAAGVPINVHDRPDLSDFIVPALVERGDVVVGISTGGASPVLARSLRTKIERLLPARLGELSRFLGRFRAAAKAAFPALAARARFWERVIDGPIGDAVLSGREPEARRNMLALLNRRQWSCAGAVYLVGAGPGDPDLLTLRALQLMQCADVVLYDELVAAPILDYVRRDAERVCVGKTKGQRGWAQHDINRSLLVHARAGRRVLRLKSGDPFIFGRGGEELEYLRRHGVECVVVPGITAALGCAAAAQVPLTHRDYASAVTFVSGHGRGGDLPPDLPRVPRPDHTLAVYMGASAAAGVAARLIEQGLPRDTPAIIIARGTQPDQATSAGTVAELPQLAARIPGGGPALIIIGAVAALAERNAEPALLEHAA